MHPSDLRHQLLVTRFYKKLTHYLLFMFTTKTYPHLHFLGEFYTLLMRISVSVVN